MNINEVYAEVLKMIAENDKHTDITLLELVGAPFTKEGMQQTKDTLNRMTSNRFALMEIGDGIALKLTHTDNEDYIRYLGAQLEFVIKYMDDLALMMDALRETLDEALKRQSRMN